MNIELSMSLVAFSFLFLCLFFIIYLVQLHRSTRMIQKDVHEISVQLVELIRSADGLVKDVEKKSKSLDGLFGLVPQENVSSLPSVTTEVLNWILSGVHIFKEIKKVTHDHQK